MAWQDIVAEKRRIQVEAIKQFAASRGDTEAEKLDCSDSLSKSVDDGEILRQISSAEISCESVTASRVEK